MKNIQIREITDLPNFDPDEFCVTPHYWGYSYVDEYRIPDIVEEAKKLAENINGICIAIIHDGDTDYVIGERCNSGMSSKFMLLNAAGYDYKHPAKIEARAITFNTGRGALTRYWLDWDLVYKKGSII